MKKKIFFSISILLILYADFNDSYPESPIKNFFISATKYQFTPSEIILKINETVELDILAEDVNHGFCSKELNIYLELPAGDEVKYIFTPNKIGTFEFYCCVYCGINHKKMRGKIKIEGL